MMIRPSTTRLSVTRLLAALALSLMLAACGGGGGSPPISTQTGASGSSGNPSTPTAPTTPSAPKINSPMGCGTVTSTGTGNTTPVVIDGFPCAVDGGTGTVNAPQEPYVSVKICAPGSTTNCQIIDHIILDTGSSGLRIAAAALSSSLQPNAGLPLVAGSVKGSNLTECETYVDSYAYGPVVNADVYIAGESALNTSMQVFGVGSFAVPTGCSSVGGTETDTIVNFNGNGLLGVGFATTDYGLFFDCPSGAGSGNCTANTTYLGMPNTITKFASDNNGIVITLPTVAATGAVQAVVGSAMFGVATQSNNTPGSSVVALANDANLSDQNFGTFATQVGGKWYAAYIDSGTDVAYFDDAANKALVDCPSSLTSADWYCPTSTQSVALAYANYGSTTTISTVNLSVISPLTLNTYALAYSNIAGYTSSSSALGTDVALGLSTFFGHSNYFLFAGQTLPGTTFGGSASTPVTGPINGIE